MEVSGKGDAFVVVAHRKGGKRRTLAPLVPPRRPSATIAGRPVAVLRRSNATPGFERSVERLARRRPRYVLLTLCPHFGGVEPAAEPALRALAGRYRLHFFVLRHGWRGRRGVSEVEIARLRMFGEVHVHAAPGQQDRERAEALRKFLGTRMP